MPYKTKGGRLINEVTLGDGYPLSSNLKPLKVGGKTSPIEMSSSYPDNSNNAKVKVTGDLEVTKNLALKSGSITSNLDVTGDTTITGDLTVSSSITGDSFVGVPIWAEFPFIVYLGTAGLPYYRDIDDSANSFRRWDDYDSSPTGFSYADVPGNYTVPRNCTLTKMLATVTNFTYADDIEIHIYHGTPNLDTASNTTLALAGGTTTISVGTARRVYQGSRDIGVDLDAGDIVVPMVEHNSSSGNCSLRGSITLEFITR